MKHARFHISALTICLALFLCALLPRTSLAATATFTDTKLYDAVKSQLTAKNLTFAPDDSAHTLTLADSEAANLTSLDLSTCAATNTTGLSTFSNLKQLDLSHNSVSDITGLAGLTKLEDLNLYDNYVHDLTALSGLSALTHLNLGENNEKHNATITGLSSLAKLTNLTWLDFSENYWPDITNNLTGLTKLEHLNLQKNNLKNIDGLSALTGLKSLILCHNDIAGISALLGLTKLEELDLMSNRLYTSGYGTDTSGIDGLVKDDGTLAFPNLKRLDLFANYNDKLRTGAKTDRLFELYQQGKLELGFMYDRIKDYDTVTADAGSSARTSKLADLPHTDSSGTYVTYDDFGAYCDGVHDDFNAIRNAHRFANACGCEVRATAGKTYHIFRLYDLNYHWVYTNVDWQGAHFVVHEENIDSYGVRFIPMLCLRPGGRYETASDGTKTYLPTYDDIVTLGTGDAYIAPIAGWAPRKTTTSLATELASTLATLNTKGYSRYYVMVFNSAKKHYIRFGPNANGGSDQWDGVIVDSSGNLESGQTFQWDFDQVTKVIVTPLPATRAHIKNATFEYVPLASGREVPQKRSNKSIYFLRNLQIRDCGNVEVANIKQTVGNAAGGYDNNRITGSYYGFFALDNLADVQMHDCTAWARRFDTGGRSTYGYTINRVVNITLTRVSNSNPWEQALVSNRWGNTGNNHCKHITYDSCTLNRIDAHEGYYDLTARNCKLGVHGFTLIGQGPLTIQNCEVHGSTFVTLRDDYGSTWDGDALIKDCTHHVRGAYSTGLFGAAVSLESDGSVHDFGYPLKMPNITVENLTIDDSEATDEYSNYYIVGNHTYGKNIAENAPASYWPDSVSVNGVNVRNYDRTFGYPHHFALLANETGTVMGKYAGYTATGVTFEGSSAHVELSSGSDLTFSPALPLTITKADAKDNRTQVALSDFSGKELAIEYTGTMPYIGFMDEKWHGWIQLQPICVERGTSSNVAYFSSAELKVRWGEKEGSTWTNSSGESGTVLGLKYLRLMTAGSCEVKRVVLVDEAFHQHLWGAWTLVTAPSCLVAGQEKRVCETNSAHVLTRELEALGHDWGEWTASKAATATEDGLETRTCKNDASHVETRVIPKTGGGEQDPGTGGAPESPAVPESPATVATPVSPAVPETAAAPETADSSAIPQTAATAAAPDEPEQTAGWTWDSGSWRYRTRDGAWATGWVWDGSEWYLLDAAGFLKSGWAWDGGWYHLHAEHDGRFGAMDFGWVCDGRLWYYLNDNANVGPRGLMYTGWLLERGEWYHLHDMVDGWLGAMDTGWVWDWNWAGWYWLGSDGAMLRSGRTPDGCWVDADGRWLG